MRSPHLPLRSVVVLGVCLALASPAIVTGEQAEGGAVLIGTWLRDERQSDDAAEKVREATAGGRGGGVTFGPGGGGFRTGGRGGPGSQARGRSPEGRLETLVRGLDVLRIEQEGNLIQILNANRETRLVYTDGRPAVDGFGSETTASLRANGLVIVTRNDRGQRVDTFEVAGDLLTITTDIQGTGAMPDLTIRSVYERVPGEASARVEGAAPEAPAEVVVQTATFVEDDAEQGWTPPVMSRAAVAPAEPDPPPFVGGSVIRALPPESSPGQLLRGKVEIQTLTIDPAVATVEFWVDDERVERRKLPPFEAKVALADPPREQRVKVVAYDLANRRLGEDEIVLNRLDPPFRVRIAAIEGDRRSGSVTVRAEVSVPRKAELSRVVFYLDEDQLEFVDGAPFVAEISTAGAGPESFVRVVASLVDGRELEDVELLEGGDFREEIDVHLVQLQVLVTDRSGTPVPGLQAEDFKVTDGGKSRQIERLYPSTDVALVLGLAIDSSGSMGPLWRQTQGAAEQFLRTTLGARDRAFVVDFDDQLRLLQPLTGDRAALESALGRLQPRGGTALYDSVLFSLLQYDGEPGRRALVVLTDGYDSGSRSDPNRAIEFGQRLGVPVYVIAMNGGRFGNPGGTMAGASSEEAARANLRLITDPTGGRLFQVGLHEQVEAAFRQIQAELRNQYVLMYYTDRSPELRSTPEVEVEGKGLRVKTAIPLDLAD